MAGVGETDKFFANRLDRYSATGAEVVDRGIETPPTGIGLTGGNVPGLPAVAPSPASMFTNKSNLDAITNQSTSWHAPNFACSLLGRRTVAITSTYTAPFYSFRSTVFNQPIHALGLIIIIMRRVSS